MPASPSSLLTAVAGKSTLADTGRLLPVLASVPDPRKARGKRYQIAAVLGIGLAAAVAGCRSFCAIAEWADDAPPRVLADLGVTGPVPCETTIRRVLEAIDDEVLARTAGVWLQNRAARRRARRDRQVIAVDGKTTRGARVTDATTPHLLAAFDADAGVVLGQLQVGGKSNEITSFAPLLDGIDLTGTVLTADALHTQRTHVEYLAKRGADWVLTVKGNQPSLLEELKALPWQEVDVAHEQREKHHGRLEWRSMKVVTVSRGIRFPHAAQAIQIIRRRKPLRAGNGGTWQRETVYAITSLTAERAQPAELARILRRHWSIENELHWVRDMTFGEDASSIRTGQGPAVMATLRNIVISLAHLSGATNIAAWLRHNSHDPTRTITALNSG